MSLPAVLYDRQTIHRLPRRSIPREKCLMFPNSYKVDSPSPAGIQDRNRTWKGFKPAQGCIGHTPQGCPKFDCFVQILIYLYIGEFGSLRQSSISTNKYNCTSDVAQARAGACKRFHFGEGASGRRMRSGVHAVAIFFLILVTVSLFFHIYSSNFRGIRIPIFRIYCAALRAFWAWHPCIRAETQICSEDSIVHCSNNVQDVVIIFRRLKFLPSA